MWTANSKHGKKLESVQTQAGVLIFKLNEKTHQRAVRALMGVCSLESRWAGFRLRYYANWHSRDKCLLIRRVLDTVPGQKKRNGPGNVHWWKKTGDLIKEASRDSLNFMEASHKFNEYRKQFDCFIPRGNILVDPDAPRDREENLVNPIGEFVSAVKAWTWWREQQLFKEAANASKSTITTMAVSLREVN